MISKLWGFAALLLLCGPARAVERYDWDWVKKDDGTPHVVRDDILIDAPIERVWKLVADPNGYEKWNQSLKARTRAVAPGSPIELDIRLCSTGWTHSSERIDVVDPVSRAISWRRHIAGSGTTNRWQLLEQEGHYVHYYTALQTPGAMGWLVDHLMAWRIKRAFHGFAIALRQNSEQPY